MIFTKLICKITAKCHCTGMCVCRCGCVCRWDRSKWKSSAKEKKNSAINGRPLDVGMGDHVTTDMRQNKSVSYFRQHINQQQTFALRARLTKKCKCEQDRKPFFFFRRRINMLNKVISLLSKCIEVDDACGRHSTDWNGDNGKRQRKDFKRVPLQWFTIKKMASGIPIKNVERGGTSRMEHSWSRFCHRTAVSPSTASAMQWR